MKTITISTDGTFRGREVHSVDQAETTRQYFGRSVRTVVEFTVTPQQAFDIAIELLFVAVDQGLIAGWNVSFPDDRKVA